MRRVFYLNSKIMDGLCYVWIRVNIPQNEDACTAHRLTQCDILTILFPLKATHDSAIHKSAPSNMHTQFSREIRLISLCTLTLSVPFSILSFTQTVNFEHICTPAARGCFNCIAFAWCFFSSLRISYFYKCHIIMLMMTKILKMLHAQHGLTCCRSYSIRVLCRHWL